MLQKLFSSSFSLKTAKSYRNSSKRSLPPEAAQQKIY
jgi:hypothetical protein